MVDYGIAVKRPFSNWGRLIIGTLIFLGFIIAGVLFTFPFSLINLFIKNPVIQYIPSILSIFIFAIPTAYFVKCALTASKKDFSLPDWSGFRDLFKNGVMLGIISIIYWIPAMIIMTILMISILGPSLYSDVMSISSASFAERMTPAFEEKSAAMGMQMLSKLPIFLPTMLIIWILVTLVFSVASFRFIEKNNFGEAFNFPEILKVAFSPNYIIASLLGTLLMFAALIVMIIAAAISAITIIGIVLIPFIITLAILAGGIIFYTIIGQAYAEAK
jgi:hypothetical protein